MEADDINKLRPFLRDYLEEKGLPTKKGAKFRCLNPNHPDHNPSMGYDAESHKAHCFSCGVSYSIFDLVMMDQGLDFAGAVYWVAERYAGMEPRKPKAGGKPREGGLQKLPKEAGPAADYLTKRGFRHAAYICEFADIRGDAEGIYFPHKAMTEGGREITDYQERYFKPKRAKEGKLIRYDRSMTPTTLYNPAGLFQYETAGELTIIVTEGEIDCLSIYDLKQDDAEGLSGVYAVALSGAANYELLKRALEGYKGDKSKLHFLIATDDDDAGEKAKGKVGRLLDDMGFKRSEYDLLRGFHDLNERLIGEREGLLGDLLEYKANSGELEARHSNKRRAYMRLHTPKTALNAIFNGFESKDENLPIELGFPALDKAFSPMRTGLVVLAAASSTGKTTLLLQIADQIAAQDRRDVLFFSLEQSAKELVAKSLSRLTFLEKEAEGVATTQIGIARRNKKGALEGVGEHGELALMKARLRYLGLCERLYVYDPTESGGMTLNDIENAVKEHIEATGNVPIVFIDYLQVIATPNARLGDKQAMDQNVSGLRRLCSRYKTIVFAISSLSRASYYAPVSMESCKESGGIEYGADMLLGLNFTKCYTEGVQEDMRKAAGQGGGAGVAKSRVKDTMKAEKNQPIREMTIEVLKNRNGENGGKAEFKYYAKYNTFEDLSPRSREKKDRFLEGCDMLADKTEETIDRKIKDDDLPF